MEPQPIRGALLRPLARAWIRGPATRERDVIVLDHQRAERYEPMLESRVGLELARVRTPDEAVAFVTRFGPLRVKRRQGEEEPVEIRESFADFERAADDLRRIIRTVLDVRKAATGDRAALARIQQDFAPYNPDSDVTFHTASAPVTMKWRDIYAADDLHFRTDDRSVLIRASDWAAMGLSNGVIDARPYVFEPAQLFPDSHVAPGGLRVGIIGESLLDYCYLTVAHTLATESLAWCDECNRVFVVEDKRQKFCEPACASRARFRRFKHNRTVKTTPKRKRSGHGKTTRTR